jgi:hypothetical protein
MEQREVGQLARDWAFEFSDPDEHEAMSNMVGLMARSLRDLVRDGIPAAVVDKRILAVQDGSLLIFEAQPPLEGLKHPRIKARRVPIDPIEATVEITDAYTRRDVLIWRIRNWMVEFDGETIALETQGVADEPDSEGPVAFARALATAAGWGLEANSGDTAGTRPLAAARDAA